MGGAINTLAFPAPNLPRQFYEDELKRRPDLVWLETTHQERIPACHVKGGSSGKQGPHMGGADVFSYEYVGYSLSKLQGAFYTNLRQQAACIRSIDAAWRYLVDTLQIPPQQIIIFGRSIGSGPSVDLASRREVDISRHSPLNVAGVILQSPLESGARAVLGHFTSFVGYHLDIFRNYEKIDKITSPVAIMHGTNDEVVPYANGEALYKKLLNPFPPLWIDGHGHNDMPQARCFTYVKEFIRHLNKGRT
ncbi:Abhd17a [Symbiodinium natans]|uniref:Abhd17a protein n=1 Tax=Symbiodinium natans TaxID=878477 RepID=A0A812QA97_9DINO|nr:Abhd17a [Symbiodinium natans]